MSVQKNSTIHDVIVIGAGFSGLSVAYELTKNNLDVLVLESENEIAGLASAFDVGGQQLDRFYHHWFTNDVHVMSLIEELGLSKQLSIRPSNTGIYYANHFFKLSTPWDLLNFKPLRFWDRIRLGLLALKARKVSDWQVLEDKTAKQWLCELGGEAVYKTVWEPLLVGKFGAYAENISAVWFWNKLKLRGSSRGKSGEEKLAYFKGGFVALAKAIAERIAKGGGEISLATPVNRILKVNQGFQCVSSGTNYFANQVVVTTALPLIGDMIKSWAEKSYLKNLSRINYLGNICLIMELDRPLSDTYWLNVNDPSFPFVGVIEHTNFESAENYNGRHIVYLSKYLPHTDSLYQLNADEFLNYAFPYLKTMFPKLQREWILAQHLWRARWSQPVVEKHYSRLITAAESPIPGFHVCSMAQIYPEDRGTNYAIREGRKLGAQLASLPRAETGNLKDSA